MFYIQTLAVPAMRNIDDPQVRRGARLFLEAGCAACHTPSHATGDDRVPALTGQVIFPYTNLLHDMGVVLADGRPDFLESGREWRAPPLWGIGLIENVNNHPRLLRAGEPAASPRPSCGTTARARPRGKRVRRMSRDEREAWIRFLVSL